MNKVTKPLLMIVSVVVCLIMVRLGVWQLDRASQKHTILDAQIAQSTQQTIPLTDLLEEQQGLNKIKDSRFRVVSLSGNFVPETTIFIDNKVFEHKVGYQVFTAFKLKQQDVSVMIDRGWISAGASREVLPKVSTDWSIQTLDGRLNIPPQKPPLWNDKYPVSKGKVWQYLPIEEFSQNSKLTLLPLVVELAPDESSDDGLTRHWQKLDDKWVGKHKAYAFQWFSMAIALLIASLVLLIRSNNKD